MRLFTLLLCLGLCLAGCSPGPRSGPFTGYLQSPLEPGLGLGDLRLGQTSLGEFLDRFGPGLPSGLFGDEIALEFFYSAEGLAFRFPFEGECSASVAPGASRLVHLVRNPQAFFDSHPACRGARLGSLSVLADRTERKTAYKGSAGPIRLFTPLEEVLAAGAQPLSGGPFVAGSGPGDDRFQIFRLESGLLIYLRQPPGSPEGTVPVVEKLAIYRR